MFSGFKQATDTFEQAVVVPDAFHLMRLGLQVVDEVYVAGSNRSAVTAATRATRCSDPVGCCRLTSNTSTKAVNRILERLRVEDIDDELAAAWVVADLLRRMCQALDRGTARRRLVELDEWAIAVAVNEPPS